MKRFICIILAAVLCVSFAACKTENPYENMARVPHDHNGFATRNYLVVANELKGRGFTNVAAVPLYHEKASDYIKNGEVSSVLICGTKDFTAGQWLASDVEIIIEYHVFPQPDEPDEKEVSPDENFALADYDKFRAGKGLRKDTYLYGTITKVDGCDNLTVEDSRGNPWYVKLFSGCDFTEYEGTSFEIFGFLMKSGDYKGEPLLILTKDTHRVVFADGKTYCNDSALSSDFPPSPNIEPDRPAQNASSSEIGAVTSGSQLVPTTPSDKVWISVASGTKYHSRKDCSRMSAPVCVDTATAAANGYEPCTRCH